MFISELTIDNLTDEIIDRVLFEGIEDTGENVDCIIVLGSVKANLFRVPAAAKAYHDNRIDKAVIPKNIRNYGFFYIRIEMRITAYS